ncbi:hypothetical protein [Streptomyces sp. NPDC058326]|uniref:hypothetical protein n=1 Tax=Streptomyces sp. NPDC058326 TaxID=3346447 RepID=UPI0036E282E6
MNTVDNAVVMAAAFKDIGNHLFGLGESWAERALKLFILTAVVITVVTKMSLKAAIGSVIALVICLGIYNARTELSDAFKEELTNVTTSDPAPQSLRPVHAGTGGQTADGERTA